MDEKIIEFQNIIDKSKRMVFFGGAGVSTASGIPDFRSSDGLYMQNKSISPEKIISHSFFMSNPEKFYEFYTKKMIFPKAKPNIVHIRLAEWEEQGKISAVVTQNIDNLHTAAGSKNVIELHGNIYRNFCMNCGAEYSLDYILASDGVPKCAICGGTVKPDVVLYEEPLNEAEWEKAFYEISNADTLIVAGTSLVVYPAAELVDHFYGKNLIIINNSEISAERYATLVIREDMKKVFEQLK